MRGDNLRPIGTVLTGTFAFMLVFATHAAACIWDSETLLQERSRFPSVLEIILGKFPRHTKDYYRWRLEDRLKKLEQRPDDDLLLDDIAVSYEKLERYEEAIAVATKQLQRNPERYESLANLGTFLIHSGKLKEGLSYIEKAIEVNPNAHFGREKYQVILVKYVLAKSEGGSVKLPLERKRMASKPDRFNMPFLEFLEQELPKYSNGDLPKQFHREATVGILGMMRFSRYKSPFLLEALGELQRSQGARQLSYRAYKSAAQQVQDPEAKEGYERLASDALNYTLSSWKYEKGAEIHESEIAADFLEEQSDADKWFAAVAADERKWIAAGEAVDVKFNEKYRHMPSAITTDPPVERASQEYVVPSPAIPFIKKLAVCMLLIGAIVVTLIVFRVRNRYSTANHAAKSASSNV